MKAVLHTKARKSLVKGYEKIHDAAGIAQAYSVSIRTVYRLVKQKRETGSVALRTNQHGRKLVLTAEEKEGIREELRLSASYSTVERVYRRNGIYFEEKIAVRQ